MKIVAFVLMLNCIENIATSLIKPYSKYKNAKAKGLDAKKIRLKYYVKVEALNIVSLIFFIIFIIKY